jgi:hypothetical protein
VALSDIAPRIGAYNPGGMSEQESRAELALSELCSKLGYCDCLYPPAKEAILANPPPDAETFVDAVLIAEGRDPNLVPKEDKRPMLEIVKRCGVYDGPVQAV